jgi:hypothetical protein
MTTVKAEAAEYDDLAQDIFNLIKGARASMGEAKYALGRLSEMFNDGPLTIVSGKEAKKKIQVILDTETMLSDCIRALNATSIAITGTFPVKDAD